MLKFKKDKKENKEEDNDFFKKGTINLMDLITPDGIVEGKDYIYLGPGRYARVYAIIGFPRNMTIGYLNELFQMGDIDITTYVENIPDSAVIRKLTGKYSQYMSNINLQLKHGYSMDYGMKLAAEDLDETRAQIQTNTERMFYVQPIVVLWGKNLSALDDKAEMFDTICARKSLISKCLVGDQLKGFLTGVPNLNIEYTSGFRNMITGSVACLIPVGNTELCHKNGIFYGENMFTKSPIVYNEFIGAPTLTNPHTFVSGTTGAGKSVFLKLKAARSAAAGRWTVILDPQEEYQPLIEKLGGQYIQLRPGVKSGINPFEIEVEEDENEKKKIDIYGKRSEIIEMISIFSEKFRNGNPLQGEEITAVDECTAQLYENLGITEDPKSLYEEKTYEKEGKFYTGNIKKDLPTLSDLRNALIEKNKEIKSDGVKELIEVMKMITGDGPMAMFDCKSTISFDSKIIAISYKHLNDEFTKFYAMINSLSWIWTTFSNYKYKDIEKEVIVDEGHLFAKFERSLHFLELIARLGRKLKIALTLATQFMQDFIGSKQTEAIIHLCGTKILLKQEASVAKKVCEFLGLSSRCEQLMTTFISGQAILLSEQELVLMHVKPFDFEWDMVKTS
ncbi:type IV secretory pathway VirB4 component [Clostridium acetobutylicum]|uniref:VirB4 family type IV secretion system protein n=3 Tax=Clostridiaceae TaxID=31979 RepID=UPI000200A6A9|nr:MULTISPECIES: DUF87 domain-containing protein [Clostridium]ADZ21098.1 Conjugative transfer gene, ATPase [Clostridium acetobutylicum EA 2018]NOV88868.1 type IV secretory pathway VirB4 component [Clostridium acetobutylicum]NOW12793.1 type IV secretory pathway VirB4 component [Clostridium acetobutylicum]NRY55169.1 type IV secretory pathway VirB4 component [Clostridium acetobutylicum]NSA92984.1 type IV secretory pathway VirB4 component [Clostridium acetobutylicum]